ncbi:hypothetical protein [Pseudomonas sp. FH1]|uniref:hypothetical protein n=1 Tax=Pseudomonas sp. FH1 TaxID=1284392 RepID=UPI0012E9D52F|nr:hypothetical protein [Pseudomonas sp. FH1]
MTDLICRKSMNRCQTPGMCSPHGGCQTPETASAFRALLAERNSLAYLLKRFVDGEHDQGENQAERHMYHDEAQTLLAYLGGEVQGHTLVPDEALRTLTAERDKLIEDYDKAWRHDLNDKKNYVVLSAEVVRLSAERDVLRKSLTDVFNHIEGNTECLVRDLVNWGTPKIDPNDFYAECETIKAIASAALNLDVATPSTDNETVSRHEA